MKTLILACGWLGLPLAEKLIRAGHKVFGTCTSTEKANKLRENGIFAEQWLTGEVLPFRNEQFDFVVVNIPPSRTADYADVMSKLSKDLALSSSKTVFVSSTSVYDDVNRVISESDEQFLIKTSPIYLAEESFRQYTKALTLRMSGLTGNGRVFAKYFAGKQVAFSENPVNHVFIHDATEAIVFALKNFKENKIYNVAAPEHPAKREVIEAQIEMHPEYAPAGFDGRKERFKIISSEKIIQEGFKFAYANPRFFI